MSVDKKILGEFTLESKRIVVSLKDIINSIQVDPSQVKRLVDYSNQVDRIMGAAQSLAVSIKGEHALHLISELSAICKIISLKAAQLTKSSDFLSACLAILKEGTENLESFLNGIDKPASDLKSAVAGSYMERFRWLSNQLAKASPEGSAGVQMSQADIDELMKKLGLN
jgi:hypothetical protein